ncbi:MAG: ImmA/IrrE family metallo-endopeptidase [Candidatus Obscuribacterales bacterium]|nr:ImmA/IrrE family metallo-endopeptidase [Candidatus Obscuribacterales bacterium]
MKKSKRIFGRAFWKLAEVSPTFMQDWKLLEAAGIKIRLLNKSDIAYFSRKKRVVYVGKWSSHVNKIVSIGHEYVHALLRPTTDVKEGDDRETWINERLEEETEAIVHELLILQELIAAGKSKHFGKQFSSVGLGWLTIYQGGTVAGDAVEARLLATGIDTAASEDFLESVRKGGREAVKAVLCHTTTSNTGELYPEYYGYWFDEEMDKIAWHKKRAKSKQATLNTEAS